MTLRAREIHAAGEVTAEAKSLRKRIEDGILRTVWPLTKAAALRAHSGGEGTMGAVRWRMNEDGAPSAWLCVLQHQSPGKHRCTGLNQGC